MARIQSDNLLNREIDTLRQTLYGILDRQELIDDEVIKISQRLDLLIIKYYQEVYTVSI